MTLTQPFNVRVSSRRLADNLAVEIRQCRKKSERVVSNVVVCLSGDMPHLQLQPCLLGVIGGGAMAYGVSLR